MNSYLEFPLPSNHTCPLCGQLTDSSNLEVIQEEDGKMLIFSKCRGCGVGMVARLSQLPQGIVGVGILTDVSREEIDKIRAASPVSAEEVLYMKALADRGTIKISS